MTFNWRRKLNKWWLTLRQGRPPSRTELDMLLAAKVRQKLVQTRFIGITGSAGKSTTSALLLFLLSARYKTVGSLLHNATKDIAQRLIEVRPDDQYAVFEMSGHEPGVLAQGCQLLQPDMAIVTAVSADHYRNFRSLDATAQEKSTLASAINPSGKVFLNMDDPLVAAMSAVTRASVLTFGIAEGADYQAINPVINDTGNLTFICAHEGEQVLFEIALPALHFVAAVLAAIACAHQTGIELACLAERARLFKGLQGRCSLHAIPEGRQIIHDAAKAPYATLELAFGVLAGFSAAPRKTLILGAMSDFAGSFSPKMRKAVKMGFNYADRIFLFKPPHMPSGLTELGLGQRLKIVNSMDEIKAILEADILPGEVILLKASPVSRLGSLLDLYDVVQLAAGPQDASITDESLDARWAECCSQMASSLVRLAPPIP